MILACAWTALLLLPPTVGPLALSLSLSGADAPAQGSPAAVTSDRDERAAQASDYYAKGRYVEASLEFEGLWRDFPGEPRFLFNAAASRYIAGHYAHTIAYLTEYLARGDVQGDDRKEAQAQLDEARNKVTPVKVTVTLPAVATGEVTVVAQHVARGASDLRPDLPFPARVSGASAEAVIQLEPANWILRAQGPGYAPAERRVAITRTAEQQVALTLTAAAAQSGAVPASEPTETEVPPDVARKLQIGLAVGGTVVGAVGVAVLAVGAVKRKSAENCSTAATAEVSADEATGACRESLMLGLRRRDAGAGVLGAGVGVLVGGLTWLARDSKQRRAAWIAEATIGGLALVGGAVWLQTSSSAFITANTAKTAEPWPDHYAKYGGAGGHAASAAIFGLGAGLITSAVTGLIVQRKYRGPRRTALRSLRLDASGGTGRAGLVLSGRF